jgi:hypothetical protein
LQNWPSSLQVKAKEMFRCRETRSGRLLGWDCEGAILQFGDVGVFAAITERARVVGDIFWVDEHHYHYQPSSKKEGLREFRICLDDKGCHFNTDQAGGLPHVALYRVHHDLDIVSFNTLFFLMLACQYTRSKEYPVEQGNEGAYNHHINVGRRKIK